MTIDKIFVGLRPEAALKRLTYAVLLDNLAPHLRAENPDHKLFCHSQPQNPPQLSKSGMTDLANDPEHRLSLRQADQAREDFAEILDDFVRMQVSCLPTRA